MSPRKQSRNRSQTSPKLSELHSNIFELQSLEIRRLLTTATIDAGAVLHVIGTGSADTITLNQLSNGKVSVTGVTTQFTPGTQFTTILIEAGGGNDTVTISNNVTYTAATITGNDGNDSLNGGKSSDTIFGAAGNDSLNGGVGDDYLDGNAGNDLEIGGDGLDTANYSDRTTAVKVTLDGLANDGEVALGEADNIQCEQVLGGAGNDTLTGGDSTSDYLSGGAGADQLNGLGGNDELTAGSGGDNVQGGPGDDYLEAQNNDRDTVNGGTGPGATDHDIADIDGLDVASLNAGGTNSLSSKLTLKTTITSNQSISSNPADLDPTYGTGGKVSDTTLSFQPTGEAVDSQGRVVYVGTLTNNRNSGGGYGDDMIVVRYDANGNRDTTFGSGGSEIIDFTSPSMVGGGYNDDDEAMGVVIDSSDNIFVLGSSTPTFSESSDSAVAELDSTGNLVSGFGTGGTTRFDTSGDGFDDFAFSGAVQSDGKLVILGSAGDNGQPRLSRLTTTGDLDPTFNGDGVVFPDISNVNAVAVQYLPANSGAPSIVVAGVLNTGEWQLERYTSTGAVDNSFGTEGIVTKDFGGTPFTSGIGGMTVDGNQDILVAGYIGNIPSDLTSGVPTPTNQTYEAVLGKFAAADGSFVAAASHNGVTAGNSAFFNGVTVDNQGRYVVAGEEDNDSGADFLVARVKANMTPDNTFGLGGVTTTDFGPGYTDAATPVRVLSNNKIVVGGTSFISNFDGGGTLVPAIARYRGGDAVPPNGESDVENVEEFTNYQDIHQNPPPPEIQAIFNRVSDIAKNDMLWQPDDTGTVRITLTDKNDTVKLTTVKAGDGSTQVQVNVNGIQYLYYDPTTTKQIQIYGMGGNDIILANNSVTIPLLIDGGAGNDIIQGGAGNDIIFGGAGIDAVNGNNGNDVIIGGDGIDALYGDGGRDIVIGGAGSDAIAGGADDDIEIAGTTAYDADTAANVASLQSIIAEWGQNTPVANRIAHIRTGVGGMNGSNVLRASGVGSTVFNDNVIDILTNDPGNDWFFAHTVGSGQKDQILFGLGSDTKDEI